VYRYRLACTDINKDVASRTLEGITLYRDRWLMSDDKLSFNSFSNLVEEEEAASQSAFDAQDALLKKVIVKKKTINEESTASNVVKDSDRVSIEHRSPEIKKSLGLKDRLLDRGFTLSELYGRSEPDLKELLALDAVVGGRR
jgi:hypothetical protein